MDKASLIGVLIGTVCLGLVGYEVSHGHWAMFFSLEGLLMVGGGSVSVVFMAMPMQKLKQVPSYIRRFMFHRGMSAPEVLELMSDLSQKARRDGILALEADIDKVDEPFLVAALKMAVDGMDPVAIESTLRLELVAMQERHKAGKKFFDLIKLYGPGYGLVGTLVGQIGMFGKLGGNVADMGHALAVAVVATMYGAIVANAIAGPIGDKLGLRSAEEITNREMMLQGVLSIQAGDNPRVTQEKMLAFLPTTSRGRYRAAA